MIRRLSWRSATTVLVAVVAVVLVAGGLSRLRVETGVASFLPTGDPAAHELERLARSFGGDPVVVLVESKRPRALLGPEQLPRLLTLEGRLAQLPDVAVVYGPATTLNQIAIQTQNLLLEISGRRDGLRAAAEAEARRKGDSPARVRAAGDEAAAAFERRYGGLLVRGLPAGLPTLRNPSFVDAVVYNQAQRPKPQWRHVVPSEHSVAILVRTRQGLDQRGTERLVRGVRKSIDSAGLDTRRVTVTGAPVVAAALGGQIRRELPLLGAAALVAVAGCLLAVPWTRRRRERVLPVAVMLAATALTLAFFGWRGTPISLGVVGFLPVLLGVGSYYPVYLLQGGHRREVLVVAGAAAAAFASLVVSPLPFVRDLGTALALGITFAVGGGLLLARIVRVNPSADGPARASASHAPSPVRARRFAVVAVVLAALAAAGWAALPRLSLEAHPERLAAGLPALAEARHAERVLGASGEVDVVLRGDDVLGPESLAWLREAEDRAVLKYGDRLRPILSAPDLLRFLGPSPSRAQVTAALRLLPPYLTGAVVTDDGREAVISFGVELDDLDDQRALVDGLRASLPPPPRGQEAAVTGLPVAAARGYELVSSGRYAGNLTGIAAAGVVLLIGLRRRSDALRAVGSAALATGLGLLALMLTGVSLTPVTVALGSLTAAVGCEFAVLLMVARRVGDPALRRSVFLAAGMSALGYAVLALSALSVIRQFGLVLAASVVLALLAALCVTSTLPSGPTRRRDREAHEKTLVGVA